MLGWDHGMGSWMDDEAKGGKSELSFWNLWHFVWKPGNLCRKNCKSTVGQTLSEKWKYVRQLYVKND